MSTKAMRRLASLCKNEGYAPEVIQLGEDALAEVEAIERAAKVVARQGICEDPHGDGDDTTEPAVKAAEALMKAIAKEAP